MWRVKNYFYFIWIYELIFLTFPKGCKRNNILKPGLNLLFALYACHFRYTMLQRMLKILDMKNSVFYFNSSPLLFLCFFFCFCFYSKEKQKESDVIFFSVNLVAHFLLLFQHFLSQLTYIRTIRICVRQSNKKWYEKYFFWWSLNAYQIFEHFCMTIPDKI